MGICVFIAIIGVPAESAAGNLLSMKMFAKSDWKVTYTGKKRNGKTFTPSLNVRYVYPLKKGVSIK